MVKAYRLGMASLLALALVSAVGPVAAANDKKDGKDQARRLQQKVGALEQEKSQLTQAKSQLEGQLKEATEQFGHAKRSAEAASRKGASLDKALKAAESEKTELAEKLTKSEQKLAETEKNLAETVGILRQTQESRLQLEAGLKQRTQEFSACTTKNENLHLLGVSLIKQYEEKVCLGSILQKEPLTQLKRVDAENMLDEYREKFDQEVVSKPLEERRKAAQQKADALAAEQENAEREKSERQKAEQEKLERAKAKQQNDLDKITRKVKKLFEGMEFEW